MKFSALNVDFSRLSLGPYMFKEACNIGYQRGGPFQKARFRRLERYT